MKILIKPGTIAGICRENDISRDKLARQMGVASTTAFRVEKGDVGPSPRFIAALMIQTGRPFEDLFEVVIETESALAG